MDFEQFCIDVSSDYIYLWVTDPEYSWFTHIALPTFPTMATDLDNRWYVGALKNFEKDFTKP